MTDKQLRSLNKTQLFSLLHQQELEIERLTEENAKLTDHNFNLEQAGSLAEASLAVSNVIQAAQSAADIYLESIRQVEADKLEALEKLEDEAKARAFREIARKNAESEAYIERLVIDMLRMFDSQVSSFASMKEELTELVNRNKLQHLITGNRADDNK